MGRFRLCEQGHQLRENSGIDREGDDDSLLVREL